MKPLIYKMVLIVLVISMVVYSSGCSDTIEEDFDKNNASITVIDICKTGKSSDGKHYYVMNFSDDTSMEFFVTNGNSRFSATIESIQKISENDTEDTYAIAFSDGSSYSVCFPNKNNETVKDRAISSVELVETNGMIETFKVALANGEITYFSKEYEEFDFSKEIKITFLGDSITEGVGVSSPQNRYSTILSNSLGVTEHNMGISGTVLCTAGTRRSRLPDIAEIPQDSDIVGILLGVNDFDQCRKRDEIVIYGLGDINSVNDTSTIYGALHAYCQALKAHLNEEETMIFFMTPVITSWNQSVTSERNWDQGKTNACGYTLRQLCDAIVEVCNYYDILCLDLNLESGLTEKDFEDGIHPNDSGAKKMADAIETFIRDNYYPVNTK